MRSAEAQLLIRMLRYHGRIKDDELRQMLARVQPEPGTSLYDELLRSDLVEREWLVQAQEALRRKARRYSVDPENRRILDRSFGQLALRRGWIDVGALEDAILEQQRLRRVNLHFRIGEILVRYDLLNVNQVREILAEQGSRQASCGECGAIVEVPQHIVGSDAEPTCPVCAGELRPTLFLESVQTDACAR